MQRVDKASRTNHGCAVLIIVEDRNIHFFLQALFDDETFRRLDIFQIDAAKTGAHQPNRIYESVRVFGVQLNIDGVNICKAFEKDRLTFHHGL